MDAKLREYTSHRIIHFKWTSCMVFEFCLNEVVKNEKEHFVSF